MSSGKEKILICIDWYLPGYRAGGPIRSIANMVEALQNDYEIFVLTSAYDLNEEEPYSDVYLNEWVARDKYFVKYLDRKHMGRGVIKTNIEMLAPDYIYLNSLFSKVFTMYPISAAKKVKGKKVKTILAPRGMLGDGALAIKKRKKSIFLKATRWTRIFRNVVWHATSEEEKKAIEQYFPKAKCTEVLPNLPKKSRENINRVIDKKQHFEVLKICYVSRISEIKNLEFAIQTLQELDTDRTIEYNIYGKFETEEYENKIHKLLKKQSNIQFNLMGPVQPADVPQIFRSHHLHFLPTKHENYGHSIVESWMYGCPVLISDSTPWKNLEMECVGWNIPLEEPEKFKKAILQLIDMDKVTYNKWVASCFQFYRSFVYKESDYKRYKKEVFSK